MIYGKATSLYFVVGPAMLFVLGRDQLANVLYPIPRTSISPVLMGYSVGHISPDEDLTCSHNASSISRNGM
jgi:hypothetical protein